MKYFWEIDFVRIAWFGEWGVSSKDDLRQQVSEMVSLVHYIVKLDTWYVRPNC